MAAPADTSSSTVALTDRERGLVREHLPLVYLSFRRHRRALLRRVRGEARDLLQEGVFALAEAVRVHDPAQHAAFPAYAMARIHFAMSAYAHEHTGLIRVPFITQRRRRDDRGEGDSARHRPPPIPRMRSVTGLRRRARRDPRALESDEAGPDETELDTVGDLLRDCYDRAHRLALAEMKRAGRSVRGHSAMLEGCSRERWEIPEPDCRTPLRTLAESCGCTAGQVSNSEERFRRRVARALRDDPAFAALRRLSKTARRGLNHRPAPGELPLGRDREAGGDAQPSDSGVGGTPNRPQPRPAAPGLRPARSDAWTA